MRDIRLAFIGFGNVAQGLTQILRDNSVIFSKRFGVRLLINAITDPVKGCAYDDNMLDPSDILIAIQKYGIVKNLSGSDQKWDAIEIISDSLVDVIIEMSPTNLQTGEPATSYIAEALRRKKTCHYNQQRPYCPSL